LQLIQPYSLFNQVASRVIGIFLIAPLLDAVVFDLIELLSVETLPVGCRAIANIEIAKCTMASPKRVQGMAAFKPS
jgi:hypothetical protein